MKKFNLILIFAGIFLLDGIFLPGVLGFKEGVLVMAFLLAMLLNWGPVGPVLAIGTGISFFLEIFWKLQPGSMMLLFLLSALAYFAIVSAFSVKRYVGAAVLSFALPSVAFGGGWGAFSGIIIAAFASFAFCFILFDKLCSEKNIKFL